MVLVAAAAGLAHAPALKRNASSLRPSRESFRPAAQLVLHLSPVVLLTVIFPISSGRLAGDDIGGTPLNTLWLGASLTVPWLGQAVCMPLYRALGHLIHSGDEPAINARFTALWPSAFVQSLPAVAVFAIPVQFVAQWSLPAFGTYLAMTVLHVLFAQSLVLANVGRKRLRWAAAWTAYAAVLLIAPQAWFLPPLVGMLTQLVPLRGVLHHLRRPALLDSLEVARDLRRGLLLGSVLWADKLLLFLRYGDNFPVTTVFLALLPAIVAYNYYFVRLAPDFDAAVLELRRAMEADRFGRLSDRSKALRATVLRSINHTAFLGALMAFAITVTVLWVQPESAGLVAAVAVASWLFMMTTVLSYKLDYVGQLGDAQVIGAAHLVGCLLAFALLPLGAGLYAALILLEAVLFLIVLRSCVMHWSSSEYTLFWRHATAW